MPKEIVVLVVHEPLKSPHILTHASLALPDAVILPRVEKKLCDYSIGGCGEKQLFMATDF